MALAAASAATPAPCVRCVLVRKTRARRRSSWPCFSSGQPLAAAQVSFDTSASQHWRSSLWVHSPASEQLSAPSSSAHDGPGCCSPLPSLDARQSVKAVLVVGCKASPCTALKASGCSRSEGSPLRRESTSSIRCVLGAHGLTPCSHGGCRLARDNLGQAVGLEDQRPSYGRRHHPRLGPGSSPGRAEPPRIASDPGRAGTAPPSRPRQAPGRRRDERQRRATVRREARYPHRPRASSPSPPLPLPPSPLSPTCQAPCSSLSSQPPCSRLTCSRPPPLGDDAAQAPLLPIRPPSARGARCQRTERLKHDADGWRARACACGPTDGVARMLA